MLEHAVAHAESACCCQRSSACEPISWTRAMGGARSATSDAAGNEAAAHRDERIACGGRTTARNGTGRAQYRGISFGLRRPADGEPRPLAPGSGTPQRINRAGAAMVAILVALC